jgi:two-component system CheB/CheR fusion protein
VDRRYDIQTINNAARRLLGIHSAAIGEDVVHLVRTVPSAALRTALDAALRSEPSDTGDTADAGLQVVADVEIEGRVIQVDCFPYRLVSDADPQALILVNDISNSMHARRELERQLTRAREELAAAQSQHAGELEQLRQQVQHLTSVNRDLLEANQELIEANTALHDQNEELLVGHEEAEAATEEVETLNEELQATNEEQETLNEELQATVEELNTTNDDLEARSAELQELAASLDAERERLHVILSSMSDAVLVLDQHGAPVLANDTYRRAFGEAADGVAALPVMGDAQGRLLPPDQKLPDQAVRGVPFTLQFTTAGPGGALRWFEAKGQPVRAESLERSTVITIRETGPQWGAQITTASVDGGVDGDDRSRERTARRSRMQPDEDDGGSTAS